MATTYSMEKMGTVADVFNVKTIDQTLLTLTATEISSDGLKVGSSYQLATGDPAYPVSVRNSIKRDPKFDGGFGRTLIDLSIATSQTRTDDGVLVWAKPAEATLLLKLPGPAVMSVAELWDFVSTLFCLTCPSTDGANDPSMATLTRWAFGVAALK